MDNLNEHIVFFDGVCSICNGFVDFLIKIDKHNRLQYSSLQGTTANGKVPPEYLENISSIVFFDNGQLLTESDAVINIMRRVGGFWKLAILLKLLPRVIRNYFYKIIAKNRYKWFGKKDTCRMPTPEERLKILP